MQLCGWSVSCAKHGVCMGRCWNEGNKQQGIARGLTRRSECCFGEVGFLDINTY